MDQIQIKPSASHPKTNEEIFKLITSRIDNNCKILDFGAGRGYMAQRIADHLKGVLSSRSCVPEAYE